MIAARITEQDALAQARLLLVDDESAFRRALGRQLEHRGIALTAVDCCAEGNVIQR